MLRVCQPFCELFQFTETHESPIVVDETGIVTGYSSIIPIDEGGSISVSGRTYSGTERRIIQLIIRSAVPPVIMKISAPTL